MQVSHQVIQGKGYFYYFIGTMPRTVTSICFMCTSQQLKHVLGIGILSLCLSLCVSRLYCVETAKHRIIGFSLQDRTKTSFRRGTAAGVKCAI